MMYEVCPHCGSKIKIRVPNGSYHDMVRQFHFINMECIQEVV